MYSEPLRFRTTYKTLDLSEKKYDIFYSETTCTKCIHFCIIHRKFIVIGSETNKTMDPEEQCPQNINYFEFNSDHTALFSVSNFCHAVG